MNMKVHLSKLPKDLRGLICLLRDTAADKSMHAYLVGGFVRDLILGAPNLDLDIVVESDALLLACEFAKRLGVKLQTHPRFRTATIITPAKIKIDIATCRSEAYAYPGSLPQIFPGTIEADLARRDFTINSLAVDLSRQSFGRLVDYFGGLNCLRQGVIRVFHDLSFIDDPTRIIRAIRFEQRFQFRIEKRSLRLLKQAACRGMLKKISAHRIRDEIVLLLKEERAFNCIRRLNELAGLDFIHPKLTINNDDLKLLRSIKKVAAGYKKKFPKKRDLDAWLMYFMLLLRQLNIKQIKQVCQRLGLRRGDTKRILSFYDFSPLKAARLCQKNISPSEIYRILEPLSFEVILLMKSVKKNKTLDLRIEAFFRYYSGINPYISGRDLSGMGLKGGADYKKILNCLLTEQLNGSINSRQEALEYIRRLILR